MPYNNLCSLFCVYRVFVCSLSKHNIIIYKNRMKNNDNNIKMEYAQNELRIRHVTFTMLCPLHFAISLLPFFFSLLSFFSWCCRCRRFFFAVQYTSTTVPSLFHHSHCIANALSSLHICGRQIKRIKNNGTSGTNESCSCITLLCV